METPRRKIFPSTQNRGSEGFVEAGNITNSDPAIGIIDMATLSTDFTPTRTADGGTFFLCIETEGVIKVQLAGQADGEIFTISAAQATAYLGSWYPARVRRVYKTDTTATFSTGF